MGNWKRFKRLSGPPRQRLSDEVILYAAADGALRTVDEEGTDSAVGGNGGSQPVQIEQVPLSSADLLALHTSPKELVASPGPGKMIYPVFPVLFIVSAGTTGYVDGGNQIAITTPQLRINEGASTFWCEGPTLLLQDNHFGVAVTTVPANTNLETQDTPDSFADQPLVAMQEANMTTGDGTLVIVVRYSVINTSL